MVRSVDPTERLSANLLAPEISLHTTELTALYISSYSVGSRPVYPEKLSCHGLYDLKPGYWYYFRPPLPIGRRNPYDQTNEM